MSTISYMHARVAALSALLSFFCFGSAVFGAASSSCEGLFLGSRATVASRLERLGYSATVAKNIAENAPAIAAKLDALGARPVMLPNSKSVGPVRFVYRGISIAPSEYHAAYSGEWPTANFGDIGTALRHALRARPTGANPSGAGILLELQIPEVFLHAPISVYGAGHAGSYSRSELGDERIWINRVGIVDPSAGREGPSIEWVNAF